MRRPAPLLAAAALVTLLATAGPAAAQLPDSGIVLSPRLTPSCAGGVRYDDGSFESSYNFANEVNLDFVMRFDLPAGSSTQLEQLCVCLTRTGGDSTVVFDIPIYAADGFAGAPGTPLTGLGNVTAMGVPFFPQVAFYNVDVSVLGLSLPQRFYLGASWNTQNDAAIALCGDDDGGSFQPLYASTDAGGSWEDLRGVFPNLDALGLRADFGDGGGGGTTCVPDDTTLCLFDGRFSVTVFYRRPGTPPEGFATVDQRESQWGTFFFFANSNIPNAMVTMGPRPNGFLAVQIPPLQAAELEVTIFDHQSETTKVYTKPQGNLELIIDPAAFPQ